MRTIIAATNYSHSADNAIKYAAALARHTNSRLVLFNSFEFSVPATNAILSVSTVDEMSIANSRHLQEIASNTASEFGIHVTSLTRASLLEEELDYQVKDLNADLVVIGISKFSYKYGFEHVAASVIRHAKFPVLAVPRDASFNGISKILFAFDPDCVDAANQLPLLVEFAEYFNAQIQVCHVEKKKTPVAVIQARTSNAHSRVETVLSGVGHFYKEIIADNIVKEIEEEVEDSKADLLAMVPHKYGFWEGLLHKSKTGKMTGRTHIPLLALPNPAST